MTQQRSFSKVENELLPGFRNKLAGAESTEDVKKFFVYTISQLINKVFNGEVKFEYKDIELIQGEQQGYILSRPVQDDLKFKEVWNTSDLKNVLGRFSEAALKRYVHLKKNLSKTEAKIRN